jgi:hypothetical protein
MKSLYTLYWTEESFLGASPWGDFALFSPNFVRVSSTKWPKSYTLRVVEGVEKVCSFSFIPLDWREGADSESWQERPLGGSISVA